MLYNDFIIKNKSLTERVTVGNIFIEPYNTIYVRVSSSNIGAFKKEINKYSKILEIRTTNFTDISKCVFYDPETSKTENKVNKNPVEEGDLPTIASNSENQDTVNEKEDTKTKKEKNKNK